MRDACSACQAVLYLSVCAHLSEPEKLHVLKRYHQSLLLVHIRQCTRPFAGDATTYDDHDCTMHNNTRQHATLGNTAVPNPPAESPGTSTGKAYVIVRWEGTGADEEEAL